MLRFLHDKTLSFQDEMIYLLSHLPLSPEGRGAKVIAMFVGIEWCLKQNHQWDVLSASPLALKKTKEKE